MRGEPYMKNIIKVCILNYIPYPPQHNNNEK